MCLFHHFLALWIWRAEVKKVKDNILIHLFADYPTHSVELILSEIAGAPKYLLDAPEGSLVFFFLQCQPTVISIGLQHICFQYGHHAPSLELTDYLSSWSLPVCFQIFLWILTFFCQGLIVNVLICRQQSQAYSVALLQQSWWLLLMVAGFLFLCWQLVWTLLVLSYITVRVQHLRCYEFSGVNLGRYASHHLAIVLSPPKCIV